MRDSGPRIGQTRPFVITIDPQTLESVFGLAKRLKNSVPTASCEAIWLEASPKNCHLLPSTAIVQSQNRDNR